MNYGISEQKTSRKIENSNQYFLQLAWLEAQITESVQGWESYGAVKLSNNCIGNGFSSLIRNC